MQDTSEHIKQLQLRIWLKKTPAERLKQYLIDNDSFFKMVQSAKKSLEAKQKKELITNSL